MKQKNKFKTLKTSVELTKNELTGERAKTSLDANRQYPTSSINMS